MKLDEHLLATELAQIDRTTRDRDGIDRWRGLLRAQHDCLSSFITNLSAAWPAALPQTFLASSRSYVVSGSARPSGGWRSCLDATAQLHAVAPVAAVR
jgi:hypothetical protein